MNLKLRNDERGAIIGRTGSGKSVLATYLLPERGQLAIIDPKGQFDYDAPIYSSVGKILLFKPKRFIYRPKPDNFTNLDDYNALYKYCYNRGNIFVYTDDMIGVMNRSIYPHYLQVCYQMGRAKNVAMLSVFQRPAWIPGFLISESNRFYVFPIILPADVKKIRETVPGYVPETLENTEHLTTEERLNRLHTFQFYSDRDSTKSIKARLDLER